MLKKILEARENRWNTRCMLVDKFNSPVVSVTMNIPGPHKVRDDYNKVHETVLKFFINILDNEGLAIDYREDRIDADGAETFIVVNADVYKLKQLCVHAEESHPLGRLVDIDVLNQCKSSIGRKDFRLPERKCIICGETAHICVAGRRHSLEEVLARIDDEILSFFGKGEC